MAIVEESASWSPSRSLWPKMKMAKRRAMTSTAIIERASVHNRRSCHTNSQYLSQRHVVLHKQSAHSTMRVPLPGLCHRYGLNQWCGLGRHRARLVFFAHVHATASATKLRTRKTEVYTTDKLREDNSSSRDGWHGDTRPSNGTIRSRDVSCRPSPLGYPITRRLI